MVAVGKTGKEWRKVDPGDVIEWRRLVVEERKTYREVGRLFNRSHKVIRYYVREKPPGGAIIRHRPGLKRSPRPKIPASIEHTLLVRLTAARDRMKKSGGDFDLTFADAQTLLDSQKGVCALTGLPMDLAERRGSTKGPRNPFQLSLDRIDPSKGYVKGNVRMVLWAMNAALSVWGEEVFAPIAQAFIAHRSPSNLREPLGMVAGTPSTQDGHLANHTQSPIEVGE